MLRPYFKQLEYRLVDVAHSALVQFRSDRKKGPWFRAVYRSRIQARGTRQAVGSQLLLTLAPTAEALIKIQVRDQLYSERCNFLGRARTASTILVRPFAGAPIRRIELIGWDAQKGTGCVQEIALVPWRWNRQRIG